MAIEDNIRTFVQRIRFWLAEQGQKISDMEDRGEETTKEYETIMKYVEECEWVLVSVYDPTFTILNEDESTAFNFLDDWTDEDLIQYMSDWETRWGVGESAAVSLALESITLLDGNDSSGSGNTTLPPGDKTGDRLVSTGNGNLGWETPATIFDMGETT